MHVEWIVNDRGMNDEWMENESWIPKIFAQLEFLRFKYSFKTSVSFLKRQWRRWVVV